MSAVPNLPTLPAEQAEDARLAWELVANISPLADIMRRHNLSFDSLDAKKRDPAFRHMLSQYKKHWDSELSVNQRVQLKAALLTEDTLLDVYAIVKDKDASPGQRMEAFGALARAGEVGTLKANNGVVGPQVKISINVPGQAPLTIDAAPVATIEATEVAS